MKYIFQGILLIILVFITVSFCKVFSGVTIYEDSSGFFCGTIPEKEDVPVKSVKGQQLFYANCAACHALHKRLTGPALAGVELRWKNRKELYKWIHNPAGYMKKDPYTTGLYKESGGILMTPFPNLTTKEIDAILDYTSPAITGY